MATIVAEKAYGHVVDEDELMALRDLADTDAEETDRFEEMEADLMALLRKVSDLDDKGDLYPEELAWLEGTEREITQSGEDMASMAEDILRGAAVLETRPGEDPAVAAELRRQAALAHARAADAAWVVAAARRLREKETRRVAAMEHVVDPNVMGFLARVAGDMDYYASSASSSVGGPTPEEMAAAGEEANRVEEEMAALRLWLVMAAMDCAEEALVAALRRQADKAMAALTAVKVFRASVRRYQAAIGTSSPPSEDAAESLEDDDVMA